jgi:peptide/nickel transport system permease protein
LIDRLRALAWRLLDPRAGLRHLATPVPRQLPRGRLRLGDLVGNPPLVLGSVIVFALFLLVLFGPAWAPENPYVSGQHIVPHYDVSRGESVQPPLPPSAEYPLGTDRWGNDLLSMLMHGARNTLVACVLVTVVRLLVGLLLGAAAGWREGTGFDRAVMGLVGVMAAVPTLISSMIVIYALDIRRGLPVFVVALAAVGWTEIAQYVRGEFMVLRKAPYVEGARTVGLGGLGIAVRHLLPNVVPQLLVIAFLEMAAVMMLLGELGFIGVYIGGGSRISVDTGAFNPEIATLIEVPEWGAMLADGYRWLRSKPFVVMPPAFAFFVSVLGMNALGEGLRRLVEKRSLNTAFLLRKRMLLVFGALALASVFVMNHTGPAPWFARVAGTFSGEGALAHAQALSAMQGRGPGQDGLAEAAAYIESQFRAYGLQPSWQGSRYVFPLPALLARPLAQPELSVVNSQGAVLASFRHQVDFGFVTAGHGGSGQVEAPLTLVGFQHARGEQSWESYKGLDLRARIVLLVEGNAPADFATEALIRGARAVLWVAGDDRHAARSQIRVDPQTALLQPQIPILRIRPAVADALVGDGLILSELLAAGAGDQVGPGWFTRELSTRVRISVSLDEPQEIELPCVLGYKPGSDYDLAGELIVLLAYYDGLGTDPDGTVYPAANDDASGVAVLLELARVWQDQGLDARRSVLFVAWPGGTLEGTGVTDFLGDVRNLRFLPALRPNRPAAAVQLEGVGAGADMLLLDPRSNRLHDLFAEAASEARVSVLPADPSEAGSEQLALPRVPSLDLAWADAHVSPEEDTADRIHSEKLQAVGEVLTLALTRMVRQAQY